MDSSKPVSSMNVDINQRLILHAIRGYNVQNVVIETNPCLLLSVYKISHVIQVAIIKGPSKATNI